jgi:UDP:flavonoid glycosyltransferase YjiC (YdhE family)
MSNHVSKTALFTWEIGLGFGHVMPMLPVARELKARGWRCVFALRDVREAGSLLAQEGFEVFQAPFHPDCVIPHHAPQPQSMSDILTLFGFAQVQHLRGLHVAWQSLLNLVQPDLLVASYAPLSLLCATRRSIPTLLLALPFELPPARHPLPSFRNPAESMDGASDAKIIQAVNQVFGPNTISRVHDIFKAKQTALLSFPELDAWGPRDNAKAHGAAYMLDVGEQPAWLETGKVKVFAYLSTELQQLSIIHQELLECPMEFLVYLRGATFQQLAAWQAPNIKAVNTPQRLDYAVSQCAAVLSYGGMGMTSATLMAGKPSLYITRDLESHITASLVEKLGAGLHANNHRAEKLSSLLVNIVTQSSFGRAARDFAAKHEGYTPAQLTTKILDQISDMLRLNESKNLSTTS